jgi:tetratricopeptide (TPR) repeat protein
MNIYYIFAIIFGTLTAVCTYMGATYDSNKTDEKIDKSKTEIIKEVQSASKKTVSLDESSIQKIVEKLSENFSSKMVRDKISNVETIANKSSRGKEILNNLNSALNQKNQETIAQHLNQLEQILPNSSKGLIFFLNGSYNQAIKAWQEEISKNGENANNLMAIGASYLAMSDITNAIDSFKKTLAISKDNASAYNNLGFSYMLLGNLGAAKKYIELGLSKSSTDESKAHLLSNLGIIELELQNNNLALEHFKEAEKLQNLSQNQHMNIRGNLGAALIKNGKFSAGISYLTDEIKYIENQFGTKDILLPEKLNRLALAYEKNKEFSRAEITLNQAKSILELHGQTNSIIIAEIKYNLGRILFQQGNLHTASSEIESSLSILTSIQGFSETKIAYRYDQLGTIELKQLNTENALKFYQKAKNIYETSNQADYKEDLARINYNISKVYISEKEYKKAITLLEQALRLMLEIKQPNDQHVQKIKHTLDDLKKSVAGNNMK